MLLRALTYCVVISSLVSCVKDTDFDQADNIALTPVYELDLIYFTVDAPTFQPTGAIGSSFQVSDTTDIRFLDDSFVVEALQRVEVFMRFNNSIPRDFETLIEFVNVNDRVRYSFSFPVQAGSVDNAIITEHIQIIESAADIEELTKASRVVVTVTVPESPEGLEGSLNLQSKSTYFLEY